MFYYEEEESPIKHGEGKKTVLKQYMKDIDLMNQVLKQFEYVNIGDTYKITFEAWDGKKIRCTWIVSINNINKTVYGVKLLAGDILTYQCYTWGTNRHIDIPKDIKVPYKKLKTIIPFDPNEAPLVVNYKYISDEFKDKYFKNPPPVDGIR